jgi:hypothetical protein
MRNAAYTFFTINFNRAVCAEHFLKACKLKNNHECKQKQEQAPNFYHGINFITVFSSGKEATQKVRGKF